VGHDPAVADRRIRQQERRGEARLPAAIAVLAAVALYALLPNGLTLGPRLVIPVLELALLGALVAVNPVRMDRETRWSRRLSLLLVCLIGATNLVALVQLVRDLAQSAGDNGPELLLAAGQVWLTNVIVFGLAYWELDRGGPVVRTHARRESLPRADFRFTQDENRDTTVEVRAGSSQYSGWVPTYVDYLYVSLTNSSAFSPTDTMPLSSRAKLLMGIEATAALVTSVLVIARGIGSLGG
jgi:hypothetical protein